MRTVKKDPANRGYIPLRGKPQPLTSADATKQWNAFGSRQSVLNALLAEQYHLCCYSEVRADQEELGYHIEHVENKSQNPQRTFDPSNLAASAIDDQGMAKLKAEPDPVATQKFGGHAPLKALSCDMVHFVSCFQADCASYFVYLSDGRIQPRYAPGTPNHQKADYTITQLNLNSPYLISRRRRWWNELQGPDASLDDDPVKLAQLAGNYLLPDEGKLNHFFSLTRHFYGDLAERVLAEHAPELV